jgi:tRNA 2-thiouridine synthesizing protein A
MAEERRPVEAAASAQAVARELDCRGLNCPTPVLRTKKAIVELEPGQRLRVLATDPGSVADMGAFSRRTGNRLVAQDHADGVYVFVFERAGNP